MLQESNAAVSPSTARHYAYMLGLLQKRLGTDIQTMLDRPQKYVHAINVNFPELQTRKSFFSAVCALLKHPNYRDYLHTGVWCHHAQRVNEAVRDRYDSGKATKKQDMTYVPWTDILKSFDKVRKNQDFPNKEHLLLAMYILEPPKRLDYASVRIVTNLSEIKDGENGMTVPANASDPCILHMRSYKTHKKYGDLDFDLSNELSSIIRASLQKEPRTHLFMTDGNRSPYKDNSFAKLASRTFAFYIRPGVTVNTLRHSMIKHVYENPRTTHKERIELSRRMCHGIDMQSAYAFELL